MSSESGQRPALRLECFFSGRTRAWGTFQDRSGRLRRQFQVDAKGDWDGDVLTLVEDFTYSDGEQERRTWRMQPTEGQGYRAQADGMVGRAEGRVQGNSLAWRYDFALRVGKRNWVVRFEDCIVLLFENVLLYRSKVSKFGFRLGEVTMVFMKESAAEATEPVMHKTAVRA